MKAGETLGKTKNNFLACGSGRNGEDELAQETNGQAAVHLAGLFPANMGSNDQSDPEFGLLISFGFDVIVLS